MRNVPRLFADVTTQLEDLHAIAIEGQRRDNAPDMIHALVSQIRMSVANMDATLGQIVRRLGDSYDR